MNSSSLYGSSNYYSSAANSAATFGIWTIIAVILAIGGGIALYCTFLSKKNDGKYDGFLGWLYDTLSFKKMVVEMLLKIAYLVGAIFITLESLGLIAVNIITALAVLVGGNLLLRVAYEFMLMTVIMVRNTSDINSKLDKIVKEDKKEE